MTAELKKKNISGAILAGGKASRLGGIAKGTIEAGNGICVIERLISELYEADLDDIVIVANDTRSYRNCSVKIIPDIRRGYGPIGGIETALTHFKGKSDAVMFVPCDMPNITSGELLALKKGFIETNKPVVFAQTPGFFWHPLCTVVHISLTDMISSSIDSGWRAVGDLWQKIGAEAVQFSDAGAFMNINDFADLEKWQKVIK